MTYEEWYTQVIGKSIEVNDPTNKFQCFDLAYSWTDALNIPRSTISHLYAKDIYLYPNANTLQYFDRIPNGPYNTPVKGDLVVFGTVVGYAGHVSVDTGKSDSINCLTVDENWDTPHYYHLDSNGNHIPYTREVTHFNYNGVLGWLHPKTITVNPLEKKIADIRFACDENTTLESRAAKIKVLAAQL